MLREDPTWYIPSAIGQTRSTLSHVHTSHVPRLTFNVLLKTVGYELAVFWSRMGCPAILQSDNGSEFMGDCLKVVTAWSSGSVKIINGRYCNVQPYSIYCIMFKALPIVHNRPRHPQSQGLIERTNHPFKNALKSMMTDAGTKNWPKLVPFCQGSTWPDVGVVLCSAYVVLHLTCRITSHIQSVFILVPTLYTRDTILC